MILFSPTAPCDREQLHLWRTLPWQTQHVPRYDMPQSWKVTHFVHAMVPKPLVSASRHMQSLAGAHYGTQNMMFPSRTRTDWQFVVDACQLFLNIKFKNMFDATHFLLDPPPPDQQAFPQQRGWREYRSSVRSEMVNQAQRNMWEGLSARKLRECVCCTS